LFIGAAVGMGLYSRQQGTLSATETAAPVNPTAPPALAAVTGAFSPLTVLGGIGILAFIVAFFFLARGYTIHRLLKEPSFNLMILMFTLVLPQAAALPSRIAGWNPLDYSSSGIAHTATFLIPMTIIAVAVGLWWNPGVWLKSALLFYGIFILFYTTFFTNGLGFFSGLVGSLGYWLSQQAVQRGSQPWYYYLGVQIPIYEFLPALASIMAVIFGLTRKRPAISPATSNLEPVSDAESCALRRITTIPSPCWSSGR
jgi:hypothetical protein